MVPEQENNIFGFKNTGSFLYTGLCSMGYMYFLVHMQVLDFLKLNTFFHNKHLIEPIYSRGSASLASSGRFGSQRINKIAKN